VDRGSFLAPPPGRPTLRSVGARFWRSLRQPSQPLHCGLPPAPSTPLLDLTALVLDTETTGLNVRSDRIISAAGYRLAQGSLAEAPLFDRLIDPRRPIPAASTAFHGIVDGMVAGVGDFHKHWPELHRHLQDGLIVGHQVYFDLAILGREVRRLGGKLQPPVALDTALLFAALHPGERHRDLTPCCAAFDIEVVGRHTARGDAEATGRLFLKLVPLLIEHGITTLGEALAFERAAILQHPRRWHW
jgi:DNA polymerase-3 subunit epsilon